MLNYLVLDLETTDNKEHDRVGNFYYGKILAISCKNYLEQKTEYCNGNLKDLEIDEDILVGHNIKFDLLYLWSFPGIKAFFKRGGKVFDTALAEYYISGQTHKYPALRDIGVNKYGCLERKKNIDDLVFNKKTAIYKNMKEVPKELVLEDVQNDVRDTEQVYLKQLEYIKKNKMEALIDVVMDSLLATTEMEVNGMEIDQHILIKNRDTQQKKLDLVQDKLNHLIGKYWK